MGEALVVIPLAGLRIAPLALPQAGHLTVHLADLGFVVIKLGANMFATRRLLMVASAKNTGIICSLHIIACLVEADI